MEVFSLGKPTINLVSVTLNESKGKYGFLEDKSDHQPKFIILDGVIY